MSIRAAKRTGRIYLLSTLNGICNELSEFDNYMLIESLILDILVELGSQHRLNEMNTI